MGPSDETRRQEQLLNQLRAVLSPMHPIRAAHQLRGRAQEYDDTVNALRFGGQIPFVYGARGVGKTSLARTAAQQVASSSLEHIYLPCAPNVSALSILRELAVELSRCAVRTGKIAKSELGAELNISASPSLKFAYKQVRSEDPQVSDVNEAVRIIREFDTLLAAEPPLVVVFDELEEMDRSTQADLAFFIKQIGDQEFRTRFLLSPPAPRRSTFTDTNVIQ